MSNPTPPGVPPGPPPRAGPYGVILADPPWRYNFSRSRSRRIEKEYPTMSLEEICDLGPWVQARADPAGCVLFLWATAPKLPQGLWVLANWGFTYKTGAVWDKCRLGMGYWFRGQHEHLLVGTLGKPRLPPPATRRGSVFRARRGRHSGKPQCVQDWIDVVWPDLRKLEMFARAAREGWDAWGKEAPAQ